MSLKNVHVLFVVIATLLVLFCGVQAFGSYRAEGSMLTGTVAALASLGLALLLAGYERRFIRRCREEGIR